jgi:flagellum-specific peptidoglycan hydrolase FlgJ
VTELHLNKQFAPEQVKAAIPSSASCPAENGRLQASDSSLPLPRFSPQQLRFLLRVAPAAMESERAYEVPACVTMAQAILESATSAGWGSSSLFRLANNPFGIKYEHFDSPPPALKTSSNRTIGRPSDQARPGQPTLQQYSHFDAQTWEIVNGQKKEMMAQFQRFKNLSVAFVAHAQLLCSPRYRGAFEARRDWKQFAERLGPKTSTLDKEHCGYSTNPSYSAELIKLYIAS